VSYRWSNSKASEQAEVYYADMKTARRAIARFTPDQRAQFDKIMEGREPTLINIGQAADIVLRESIDGGCCARCARDYKD